MKVLIAVLSCESFRLNGNNQAIRDTWMPFVKSTGADCKIFMGQGSTIAQDDEVFLDAPDDYQSMTYKTKALYRYADQLGYDFIFKCYPDTYVCPSRLMSSGFEKYDYSGNFACKPLTGDYCCGGTGVWLSRAAYVTLIDASIVIKPDTTISMGRALRPRTGRGPHRPNVHPEPYTLVIKNITSWAEDQWSGDIIRANPKLIKHHDARYEDNVMSAGPEIGNQKITIHLSRPLSEGMPSHYEKEWLHNKHRAYINSSPKATIGKIAVVTPTLLSRHALLKECQASVASQVWNGYTIHVIRVDEAKEGPAITRNKIVKNLDPSIEWLAFVDDDDRLFPEHLATLTAASNGADVVYSDCKEEGFTKTWNTRPFQYMEVRAENYIPVTVLMRRSLFDKVGGFNSTYPGEDQNLWLRAYEAGGRFVYVPRITWTYRQHPDHRKY